MPYCRYAAAAADAAAADAASAAAIYIRLAVFRHDVDAAFDMLFHYLMLMLRYITLIR